ncbi:MAG: TIR domain-containing protein [Bacteroidales bacterium]|nr:TIR domain-containing protein [Bacteroidales bacterium]
MAYEWFISYRRKSGGENQARQVAEILSKYVGEDKVFYDRESMREGNWREQINEALQSAEHFVLLVNEASAAEDQSNNVGGYRYEIEYALNSEKLKNNRITIIAYDNESYKAVTKEFSNLSSAQKVTYYGEYAKNFEERLCDHFEFEYQKPSSASTIIKNISYPENLIPRRDMLDKLDHEFNSHQCVVISGIGGSGKTSLAYLYIKEQNFGNVAWVTVNGKIEDVFLDKIAGLLFTENDDYERFTRTNDKQTKLDIIKTELSKIQGNNLLVFDINTNNEAIKQEIESELYNYLPAENWKTLILTRARVINATRFSVIEMGSMVEEDTINLFKNNYGGDIQFTDTQLAEIAQELYYHPLLIEQTAIYFSDGIEDSAEEIIDKIKDKNKVNNERTNEDLRGLISEGRKEKNVKNYLLNLCNIDNLSQEEVKFLAVYVTWPAEPISKEIIKTLLPGTDASLRTLIKKGIISRNGNQYVIHSLMADVIREQINISEFDYTEYMENIKILFSEKEKKYTLHEYSKYFASSFVNYNIYGNVNEIFKKLGIDADSYQAACLYDAVARAEEFKNNLSDAKSHFEKALELKMKLPNGGLITTLLCLADIEKKLGDTVSAKKHEEEAMEILDFYL